MFGALLYMIQRSRHWKLEHNYLESFEMWCWRLKEKIKWPKKVNNEEVVEYIEEKRSLFNNILRRKTDWIGHVVRRNCLFLDAIEGQMMEVKRVEEKHSTLIN